MPESDKILAKFFSDFALCRECPYTLGCPFKRKSSACTMRILNRTADDEKPTR